MSLVTYHTTEKQLREFFGNTEIKKIIRKDYQKFINQFGATHAPSTVQKINGFVRAAVKSAILDDYLTKNFTEGVELVGNKDLVVHVEYLNIAEIKKLLAEAKSHLSVDFTSRQMIITAIYTGMRISEIQALSYLGCG